MSTYTIYTDGACLNNGKPSAQAGWGAILTNPLGVTLEIAGPIPQDEPQTNSRAELTAVLKALLCCTQTAPITLYTDSQYIANACNDWLENWKAKGWKKADKKPPEHLDLWQAIDRQLQQKDVSAQWVKAHNGLAGNKQADTLSRLGAAGKVVKKKTTPACIEAAA